MLNPLKLPLPELLLRVAIAFAFLYPPIAALSDPDSWFGYFPKAIQLLPIDHALLLHGFGLLEVLIALWILFGKRIRVPSILATVILSAIVALHLKSFDVLFRDVSIALAALALALTDRER